MLGEIRNISFLLLAVLVIVVWALGYLWWLGGRGVDAVRGLYDTLC